MILQVTTKITRTEAVEVEPELVKCKHGIIPQVFNIYTGTRKEKFQGSVATCGNEECKCFGYDPNHVANKWNETHKTHSPCNII